MSPAALRAVLALALLLPAAGCRSFGLGSAERAVTADDRAAYDAAVARLETSPEEGEARLRVFLSDRPDSPLADDAAVALADSLVARERPEEARGVLEEALRRRSGDRRDALRWRLAQLERRAGEPETAYRTASEIRLSRLDEPEQRSVQLFLAGAAEEAGDPLAALRWLEPVRASESDEVAAAELDAQIDAVIAQLSLEDVERAAEQFGRRAPAARLRLRQAELGLAAGDAEAVQEALDEARQLPLTTDEAARLAALENRLLTGGGLRADWKPLPGLAEEPPEPFPDASRVETTLGVVLPLSGPYAAFGEASLEGVLLATRVFDAGESDPRRSGVRLLVRDSAGSAERAAAAVDELSARPEVSAILGPLLFAEAEAAALSRSGGGVPLVSLTRREGLTHGAGRVLRLGLSPRSEAEVLAEVAREQLAAQRFAILYPRDGYGRQMRRLFWQAVEARGGQVVGVASYDPEATDFATPIRRLIGYAFLSPEETEAIRERDRILDRAKRFGPEKAAELRQEAAEITGPDEQPLPPFVDFDALFIPDDHENVSLLAPQLAFHGVRGVRLLGGSGWNDPELLRIARRHVDGAVFTAPYHVGSRLPRVAEFERRFQATFGRVPDGLAAQAFDATNLVLRPLAEGRATPDGLWRELVSVGRFAGVSGVTAVEPDGRSVTRPHLLGVERGRIVSIDETGEAPALRPPPSPASPPEDAPPEDE